MSEPAAKNPPSFDELAEALNADIVVYCGSIEPPYDRLLLGKLERRKLRKNVLLWLSTLGGNPEAAFRIARMLQRFYNTTDPQRDQRGSFSVFVDTVCKSGGTIVVLGADRLIMSDYAELGPIDLQIRKPDEVLERSSSLTPMQALNALQAASLDIFRSYFSTLRMSPEWNFTTKTAAEIATRMSIGLMEPIYSQLDPLRLGEIDRFVKLSLQYGERLDNGNLKTGAIDKLVGGYPSHSFVIDRREAKELFKRVEEPDSILASLSRHRATMDSGIDSDPPLVDILSSEPDLPIESEVAKEATVKEDERKEAAGGEA